MTRNDDAQREVSVMKRYEELPETERRQTHNSILQEKRKVEESYLKIGELLEKINKYQLYEEWGYASFADYVEGELGYKYRKAMYLVEVYRVLKNEMHIENKQLEELDWTKAKALVPLVTKKHITQKKEMNNWVKKAKTMSLAEVKDAVDGVIKGVSLTKEKGNTHEDAKTDTLVIMKFGLFSEQYDNVQLALEKAKNITGSEKPGHLLDIIASNFLSEIATNSEEAVNGMLNNIERNFGVKIIALDKKGDTIIFGKDTLANVVKG